jgi:ribA/ribD-fused uncharacterized protein
MDIVISSFQGSYRFLSNFWGVEGGVYGFPTNEHFFQAMKNTDPQYRAHIKTLRSAAEAKRAGRRVKLREDWNDISLDVMLSGLRAKFAPGSKLAEQLLATGDAVLEEGNHWHDNFWGICHCSSCSGGLNHLGRLLMQVRAELRA